MKNTQLEQLLDMSRQCDDVKTMIRVVCIAEGATSAGHLYDISKDAFNELFDAATEMITQLGVDR